MASVTHPAFKQYWPCAEEKQGLFKLALQSGIQIEGVVSNTCSQSAANTSPTVTDFLNFQIDALPAAKTTQVDLYLKPRLH